MWNKAIMIAAFPDENLRSRHSTTFNSILLLGFVHSWCHQREPAGWSMTQARHVFTILINDHLESD